MQACVGILSLYSFRDLSNSGLRVLVERGSRKGIQPERQQSSTERPALLLGCQDAKLRLTFGILGIAYPVALSVNQTLCHFSPLPSDSETSSLT